MGWLMGLDNFAGTNWPGANLDIPQGCLKGESQDVTSQQNWTTEGGRVAVSHRDVANHPTTWMGESLDKNRF
ncbi:MAG: hypothetical protein OEZ39_20390 [Gammaproteobacteria bacterium]|nr:hypothetical protein [Gammaproteobacteria bacterium]MDH5654223.1 hypothetical protein [Gammaproteobacteria bacterium]